jgi:predicted naringenin-chalcone synthase
VSAPRIRFIGPGLAVPPGVLGADQYRAIAERLCGGTPRQRKLVEAAVRGSGIQSRHSVLATTPDDLDFYTAPHGLGRPLPGTAARMAVYTREAPILAEAAVRDLVAREHVDLGGVTHLVTVSCTGFMAPGLDHALVERLGLGRGTRRLHIGFMGCHGALNGLAAARAICAGDSSAVVLVVMVELCTLHYQEGFSRDDLLPNALFADGAAALILRTGDDDGWCVGSTASFLVPHTAELMTWRITDQGFRMTLDAGVPGMIARGLPALAASWGWGDPADDAWAIHPGGPRILQLAAESLALAPAQIAASQAVLQRFGNMSSATIMFIVRELLSGPQERMRLLAFGPGLTIESATLCR